MVAFFPPPPSCFSEEDLTGEEEDVPSFRGEGHTHTHAPIWGQQQQNNNVVCTNIMTHCTLRACVYCTCMACAWHLHICLQSFTLCLQVVPEEAVWGASRAILSSWLSKSCMHLLRSSSSQWQCWHHSVSSVGNSFFGVSPSPWYPLQWCRSLQLDAVSGRNRKY